MNSVPIRAVMALMFVRLAEILEFAWSQESPEPCLTPAILGSSAEKITFVRDFQTIRIFRLQTIIESEEARE